MIKLHQKDNVVYVNPTQICALVIEVDHERYESSIEFGGNSAIRVNEPIDEVLGLIEAYNQRNDTIITGSDGPIFTASQLDSDAKQRVKDQRPDCAGQPVRSDNHIFLQALSTVFATDREVCAYCGVEKYTPRGLIV